MYVDIGGSDTPPDVEKSVKEILSKYEDKHAQITKFPDGYFQHPKLPLTVIFIRSGIRGGELSKIDRLISASKVVVDELLQSTSYKEKQLQVHFGGEMMDMKEEQEALIKAVLWSTIITIVLVMLIVFAFFKKKRALFYLVVALIPPILLTFGVAELTVDYLNASSAFLSSIVLGNGVNPNIIWLARYFECRRSQLGLDESIHEAHRSTWAATLTASVAAGLAYASLMVTDFRGFRDFGIIGGTGMVFCWVAAYLLLPAIVVICERRMSLICDGSKQTSAGNYGGGFAFIAVRMPKTVMAVSTVLTIVSLYFVGMAIIEGPMENDFRKLQSTREVTSKTQWVNDRQGEIVDETMTGSAITILVPTRQDVVHVVDYFKSYRKNTSDVAFGAVRTIDDFLPKDQEKKLPLLLDLARIMPKLRKYADEKQQKLLDKYKLQDKPKELTIESLPVAVTQHFRENDGSVGKLVFLEHHEARNNWDGKYLVEWAQAARSVRLQNGERPSVAGQPPVFADLLEAIWIDGPRAVVAALLATSLLLVLTFSYWAQRLLTLSALLLGILWMAALMAVCGIKLNFLNFVAFPITFGNGVDYGVNLMRRYVQELELGKDCMKSVSDAVQGTGGAVVLCSLTTIIGYISLYTSANQALNSFGAAMAMSELTCVLAGVLTLPAALVWMRVQCAFSKSD